MNKEPKPEEPQSTRPQLETMTCVWKTPKKENISPSDNQTRISADVIRNAEDQISPGKIDETVQI